MKRSSTFASASCAGDSALGRVERGLLAALLCAAALGCAGPAAITHCEPGDELTPHCGFTNPEDLVVFPGGDWLLVSEFPRLGQEEPVPGRLVAWRPGDGMRTDLYPSPGSPQGASAVGTDPACPGPPDAATFAPHGIDLSHDGRHLWVVNHGGREAIERFAVDPEGPSLRWAGCVVLPEGDQANDVAALPAGGFVATRMMPADPGAGVLIGMLLGRNTGHVLRWSPVDGWSMVPGSEAVAPNGIAAAPDGRTLYVAEWGADRLVRIGIDGSGRTDVALPHHPDNLSWRGDGMLLAAGQLGSMTQLFACNAIEAGACGIAFSVVAIDPASLETRTLLSHDPATVAGGGSVALEHDGVLWIGSFASDRLASREAIR